MLLRRLGSARPRPVTARRARRSRSDGECAAPSPPRPGLRAAGAQRSRSSRDPFPPASSRLRLPGPSRPPPHLHPALPGRDPGPPPRPRPRPGPLNRVCTLGSPPRAACASQSPGLRHLCLCACTPLSLSSPSRCLSSLGFLRCLLFSRLGSLVTSLSSSWMRSSYPRSSPLVWVPALSAPLLSGVFVIFLLAHLQTEALVPSPPILVRDLSLLGLRLSGLKYSFLLRP